MIKELPANFWNGIDMESIDPEVLPVVSALRAKGVETWASCARGSQNPHAWGAYIQVFLPNREHLDGLVELVDAVTPLLQHRVNTGAELQLVANDAWVLDRQTRSRETLVPVYRLQIAGPLKEEDYIIAWQIVRDAI